MDLSPNQYTARMTGGCRHESPREWVQADRRLIDQEQTEDKPDPVEASLTDLDEYLHTLPVEEHETAIQGIREYQRACLEIDLGWHKYL